MRHLRDWRVMLITGVCCHVDFLTSGERQVRRRHFARSSVYTVAVCRPVPFCSLAQQVLRGNLRSYTPGYAGDARRDTYIPCRLRIRAWCSWTPSVTISVPRFAPRNWTENGRRCTGKCGVRSVTLASTSIVSSRPGRGREVHLVQDSPAALSDLA